jgi:crossover junction endodeoxyribonuclease RusA
MHVEVPYPPMELNPNHHCHWRVKAPIAKRYLRDCFYLCKQAGFKKQILEGNQKVHVFVDFYLPDNRVRDEDNAIASAKKIFDAISEAIGIDDRHFKIHPSFKNERDGKIVATIAIQ